MSRSTKMILVLSGLCVLEFIIFARTSADFFDGDSFFYFPYRIAQSSDIVKYFRTLDVAKQLRPLTHVFFSFVMFPLFGLRAPLYGFLSIAFHVLNTLLVFFLIRRLARSDVAAGAGAAFWGLNPVAIYITHGICFLADYFYASFYLLSIVAFLRYRETRRVWYGMATVLSFVIALGTKEAAVTLPVNMAMLAMIVLERRSEGDSPAAPAGLWIGFSCFVILITYLVAYYNIKGGAFYDPSPTGNYRFVPSLAALTSKIDALKAGLYFPFEKYPAYPVRLARLLKMALATPILGLAVFTIWSLLRRNVLVMAGLLWMFIALTPVLFIMPTEFVHNMYVPLVGVALIAGLFVEWISDYVKTKLPHRPVAYLWASLLLLMLFSLGLNQYIFSTRDWRPYYERVAKNCVRDLRRLHPVLAPNTLLYFRQVNDNMHWLTYNGKLLNIFYNDASLQVQFSDRDIFPEEAVERNQAFILVYSDNGLYDVTRDYLAESKRPGLNLVSAFSEAEISFDRSEFYPNYDRFDTPDGKPAFVAPVGLDNQFHMSLITIAGAGVHYNIPTLTRESKLEVAVAMKFDRGDGAQGRIYFEHGTARDLIYEVSLNPLNRFWTKKTIDLGRDYAGESGRLSLECNSGPKGDTFSDWFAWGSLWLTHTRGNPLGGASIYLNGTPRLNLNTQPEAAVAQFGNRRFLFSRTTCTPSNNSPVFFQPITRDGISREALVTKAGASVTFYIRDLRPNMRLHVIGAMPFDRSTGAVGRVFFIDDRERRVLLKKALNPTVATNDRHWFEETIPLNNPETPEARLILECSPGDANKADLAWFGWYLVEIYS